MKKIFAAVAMIVLTVIDGMAASAQSDAFHKGAFLLSLSEGQTWANYSTGNNTLPGHMVTDHGHIHGQRDPLFIEYGLSNHIGIGLTSGGDIFNVDPSRFYGFGTRGSVVKATTGEFTIDGHYHFLITRKADVSAFTSLGVFTVTMKGGKGDNAYSYLSSGSIIRAGIRGRYYFAKRFGALCTLSSYAAASTPDNGKGNTAGNNYATSISGLALEFGLCFRFF